MTAVVLAAGISSRLRPLTDDLPKTLLPVCGTPILHRTLGALQTAGIRHVLIVVGYHEDKIRNSVASQKFSIPISFVVNPLFASTGNNYSLALAMKELAGQDIIVLDSDILFDPEIVLRLNRAPFANALVMRTSEKIGEEEVKLEIDATGRVLHIGKEIPPGRATGESLGIERFSAATTERLFAVLQRRKENNEFYEASFQEMIDGGVDIYAVDCGTAACIEIDTPDDLLLAEKLAMTLLR